MQAVTFRVRVVILVEEVYSNMQMNEQLSQWKHSTTEDRKAQGNTDRKEEARVNTILTMQLEGCCLLVA